MATTSVRSYERSKPEKRPDPFQDIIDAKMAARRQQAEAAKRVNDIRNEIGWKRPAIVDRMLSVLGIGRLS